MEWDSSRDFSNNKSYKANNQIALLCSPNDYMSETIPACFNQNKQTKEPHNRSHRLDDTQTDK